MEPTDKLKNKAVVTYRTKHGNAQAVCSHWPSPCEVVVLLPDGSQMSVPVTHVVSISEPTKETQDGTDSQS